MIDRHNAAQCAINENEERQSNYYLIIFPPGTVLENTIFSSDDTNVDVQFAPMIMEEDQTACEVEMNEMALSWLIADKQNAKRVKATPKMPDIKKMFKKKKKKDEQFEQLVERREDEKLVEIIIMPQQ